MKYREMRQAKIMFNARTPWPVILSHFHNLYSEEHIRAAFEWERTRKRKTNGQIKVDNHYLTLVPQEKAPDFVLEERELRRGREHPELTGRICGDPLPEYSALARRQI